MSPSEMVVSEDAVYLLPIVLMEDDVPGVKLVEPLERHTIRELSWWILFVALVCSPICCHSAAHPVVLLDDKVGRKLEGCVPQISSSCLAILGNSIEAQLLRVFFAVDLHTMQEVNIPRIQTIIQHQSTSMDISQYWRSSLFLMEHCRLV